MSVIRAVRAASAAVGDGNKEADEDLGIWCATAYSRQYRSRYELKLTHTHVQLHLPSLNILFFCVETMDVHRQLDPS